MPKTLSQFKSKKLKDCPGCLNMTRMESKLDVIIRLMGADPKRAVSQNPGTINTNYITVHFVGKTAKDVFKWFVSTLIGTGIVIGILRIVGAF
jgi:hypothetical protein